MLEQARLEELKQYILLSIVGKKALHLNKQRENWREYFNEKRKRWTEENWGFS